MTAVHGVAVVGAVDTTTDGRAMAAVHGAAVVGTVDTAVGPTVVP